MNSHLSNNTLSSQKAFANDRSNISDNNFEQNNSRLGEKQMEFNIDKHEYHQVFKLFDKNNLGEININDVYNVINKFESNNHNLVQPTGDSN